MIQYDIPFEFVSCLLNNMIRYVVCVCFSISDDLEGPVALDLFTSACGHYQAFWRLREHFRLEKLGLFQLTQKAHSLMHTCKDSDQLNPCRTWCWKFEDCVGCKYVAH